MMCIVQYIINVTPVLQYYHSKSTLICRSLSSRKIVIPLESRSCSGSGLEPPIGKSTRSAFTTLRTFSPIISHWQKYLLTTSLQVRKELYERTTYIFQINFPTLQGHQKPVKLRITTRSISIKCVKSEGEIKGVNQEINTFINFSLPSKGG